MVLHYHNPVVELGRTNKCVALVQDIYIGFDWTIILWWCQDAADIFSVARFRTDVTVTHDHILVVEPGWGQNLFCGTALVQDRSNGSDMTIILW